MGLLLLRMEEYIVIQRAAPEFNIHNDLEVLLVVGIAAGAH